VTHEYCREIERSGFALLQGVFDLPTVDAIAAQVDSALCGGFEQAASIRTHSGAVYAARNVLELLPAAAGIWQEPVLLELVRRVLGADAGLVRVLYFDKPPERTWTLPWHKDLTIAVRPLEGAAAALYRVNRKGGVPHVEAPLTVLERMLTLRLHLDRVTPDNGPLKVVAGSHRTGKRLTLDDGPQQAVLAERGDVLAIRPLVSHCSGRSAAGTRQHRRILHFEFGATDVLPDGLEWHQFIPAGGD
jgi:ectoine hydroxylase-related dioxygenase (phytanoyl-CoA dioxygenase family)